MNKLRKISVIFTSLIMLFAMAMSLLPANTLQISAATGSYVVTMEVEECWYDSSVYIEINEEYFSDSYTGSKVSLHEKHETAEKALENVSGDGALHHCANDKFGDLGIAVPSSLTLADKEPALTYTFTAPKAGTYYVWLRAWAAAGSGDSIFIAVDNETNYTKNELKDANGNRNYDSYAWYKVKTNALEAGEHTIKIYPRKQYLLLDKLLITDENLTSIDANAYVTPRENDTSDPVASIGGTNYATWQEAIAAATAEDTITLLDNVETESINTETNFTLNLNGYTLKVSSFGKYVNVVDSVGGGLLEVEADACTLPPTNEQVPVYDGTKNGYVFVTIKDQNDGGTISENSFKLIFRPSFGTDATAKNTLLANGGEAAEISIGLRLDWTVEGAPKSQLLVYGKDADEVDMVAMVYSQDKAFYINALGLDNFDNLKVTPYIGSTTGVVWNGTTIEVK